MVVCGLGGYGYQKYQDQKAARQLTLYGNVDVREVAVAFRQSDRIAEELVEEGDKVTKGQVLAPAGHRRTEDQEEQAAGPDRRPAERGGQAPQRYPGGRPGSGPGESR